MDTEGVARPARVDFPGAIHHVMARANDRRALFLDDSDRTEFLACLSRAVERYGWICHAHCLMGSHYHVLIETPRPTLSRGMRHLNGVYAQRFNWRHGRRGHVFGGRFHGVPVTRDAHLLELCRYIVLNPSRRRRGAVEYEAWPWSSYAATAGLAPAPAFLTTDWVVRQFSADAARGRALYRAFVRAGLELPAPIDRPFAGDLRLARHRARRIVPSPEHPKRERDPVGDSLQLLAGASADRLIAAAYREHGYRLREIADALGMHYSTVSRRLARYERGSSAPVLLRRKT